MCPRSVPSVAIYDAMNPRDSVCEDNLRSSFFVPFVYYFYNRVAHCHLQKKISTHTFDIHTYIYNAEAITCARVDISHFYLMKKKELDNITHSLASLKHAQPWNLHGKKMKISIIRTYV